METEIFARKTRTLAEIVESQLDAEASIMEAGGEITPELEEFLAQNDADLARKIDGYSAAIREQDARAKAIAEEIKRLQALKKTAENTGARIKDFLRYNMERLGVDRVNGTTSKAYFTSSTAVRCDEGLLLHPYDAAVEALRKTLPDWVKLEISVGKDALKKALKEGGEGAQIPGACLQTNRSIVLK